MLSSFESLFGEVTHSLTFDSPIFYGASFRISNPKHGPEQIKQLGADHPNVVSIRENRLYYPTEARNRKRGPKRQEPSVRDNGGGDYRSRSPSASGGHHDASDTISQDRWGITRLTGVKQQHDLGNYGQGVHIVSNNSRPFQPMLIHAFRDIDSVLAILASTPGIPVSIEEGQSARNVLGLDAPL